MSGTMQLILIPADNSNDDTNDLYRNTNNTYSIACLHAESIYSSQLSEILNFVLLTYGDNMHIMKVLKIVLNTELKTELNTVLKTVSVLVLNTVLKTVLK